MADVTILPLTPERFDDVEHAFAGGGDGASCQCVWWLITAREWNEGSQDERREMFRAEVANGPAPGLIAYVDGEAAGWVRVGPRTNQPRLARTRAFSASPEPWDDETVWAVSCFVVRREFRGQGLNAQLLDAAVAFARDGGARVVEAYPVDPEDRKTSSNELFHGALSTFTAAGFRELSRPKPSRAIVGLTISE